MIKSVYTFLAVEGSKFRHELEPFYLNQKTKILQPLSADSQSKPSHLKTDFGPIHGIEVLSDTVIEIKNCENVALQLYADRLNPLLEGKDSKLKKTLIALQSKGPVALVNSLKALLVRFHSQENELSSKQLSCPVTPVKGELENSMEGQEHSNDNQTSSCSTSGLRPSRNLSITVSQGHLYEESDEHSGERSNVEARSDIENNKKRKQPDSEEVQVEENLQLEIEKIIREAKFCMVNFDDAEISKDIKVDADLVQELKFLLQHTPDKTQVFVGVVCKVDESGEHGKYQISVNAEIFVALFELQIEGVQVCAEEGSFYAVVHIIGPENMIDIRSLVRYLNVNAKDFSERVKESTKYQDLVRFAATVVTNSSCSLAAKTNFVKSALRGFSKGTICDFINCFVFNPPLQVKRTSKRSCPLPSCLLTI